MLLPLRVAPPPPPSFLLLPPFRSLFSRIPRATLEFPSCFLHLFSLFSPWSPNRLLTCFQVSFESPSHPSSPSLRWFPTGFSYLNLARGLLSLPPALRSLTSYPPSPLFSWYIRSSPPSHSSASRSLLPRKKPSRSLVFVLFLSRLASALSLSSPDSVLNASLISLPLEGRRFLFQTLPSPNSPPPITSIRSTASGTLLKSPLWHTNLFLDPPSNSPFPSRSSCSPS